MVCTDIADENYVREWALDMLGRAYGRWGVGVSTPEIVTPGEEVEIHQQSSSPWFRA
jgi:hypothetical protein